jgi:hypothetical protein
LSEKSISAVASFPKPQETFNPTKTSILSLSNSTSKLNSPNSNPISHMMPFPFLTEKTLPEILPPNERLRSRKEDFMTSPSCLSLPPNTQTLHATMPQHQECPKCKKLRNPPC